MTFCVCLRGVISFIAISAYCFQYSQSPLTEVLRKESWIDINLTRIFDMSIPERYSPHRFPSLFLSYGAYCSVPEIILKNINNLGHLC